MGKERDEKQKILVVDDSELKREILANILEDEYIIIQAENGQEAVRILEKRRDEFKLVLLDIMMPVMNGYEVLAFMQKRQWIDYLPVIVISAESSEDTIGRAYELGASDYIASPFESNVIRHRVHNTIALYDKISSDLKDAIGMLSIVFYRILKINLTTDDYQIIKENKEDVPDGEKIGYSAAKYLESFALSGSVHKEDREEYLDFCQIPKLREFFASGNQYISRSYRRKVHGEFRWVSMEIIRSSEYQPDNEIVVLYIRDINDDYLKQLEMSMCRAADSAGIVSMKLTKNLCMSSSSRLRGISAKRNESVEGYIKRVAKHIPLAEERESFLSTFDRENMIRCFEGGQTLLTVNHAYYENRENRFMFRTTVEMVRNSFSGEVEAVLYYNDSTSMYMAEQIPQLLYEKNYEKVGVIDTKMNRISISSSWQFDVQEFIENEKDYDEYTADKLKYQLPEKEKAVFLKNTGIEHIKEALEKEERYTVTVPEINEQGEQCMKNYIYMYLQKTLGIILAASEDITALWESDTLTGGYNREGFVRHTEDILGRASDRTQYVVLFFNLKNFKAVNEIFGMENGDAVLKTMYADLVKSPLNPVITARTEADHFACLIKKENLDFKILTELCSRYVIKDGKMMRLFGRCGIFMVEEKPMGVEGMIDRAKLAKNYITDEYVQPYMVYDSSMRKLYIDKTSILGEFQEGLSEKQFQVYYQPVVDAATGEVASAEALVRWNHPERGLMSPGLFISALEENGRISELDSYVVDRVGVFTRERYDNDRPVVPISTNLSWMDFYDEAMMGKIVAALKETKDSNREQTRFEITETSYAALEENRSSVLAAIRDQDSKILLDDFGSGYSSFRMIQDYDFDILKIDMSIVRQIGKNRKTKPILCAIIEMAHKIGIKTIAEGAETEEQVRFLRENGCDYIQGYYFSKPLPETEFVKLLEKGGNPWSTKA